MLRYVVATILLSCSVWAVASSGSAAPRVMVRSSSSATDRWQALLAELSSAGYAPIDSKSTHHPHQGISIYYREGFEQAALKIRDIVKQDATLLPLTWNPAGDIVIVLGDGVERPATAVAPAAPPVNGDTPTVDRPNEIQFLGKISAPELQDRLAGKKAIVTRSGLNLTYEFRPQGVFHAQGPELMMDGTWDVRGADIKISAALALKQKAEVLR